MNNLSDLTGSIDINIKNKFINNNLNINPNIYVGGEASLNNKLLNSEENNEYILTRLKRKSIFGSESIKDINNDNIYEELIKQNNLLSFVSRTTLNIWGIYLGKLEFIFNGDNNICNDDPFYLEDENVNKNFLIKYLFDSNIGQINLSLGTDSNNLIENDTNSGINIDNMQYSIFLDTIANNTDNKTNGIENMKLGIISSDNNSNNKSKFISQISLYNTSKTEETSLKNNIIFGIGVDINNLLDWNINLENKNNKFCLNKNTKKYELNYGIQILNLNENNERDFTIYLENKNNIEDYENYRKITISKLDESFLNGENFINNIIEKTTIEFGIKKNYTKIDINYLI